MLHHNVLANVMGATQGLVGARSTEDQSESLDTTFDLYGCELPNQTMLPLTLFTYNTLDS